MKQVVGIPGQEVKCRLESAPIPKPGDKQVLIKVVVSGSNPKVSEHLSTIPVDLLYTNEGIVGLEVAGVGPCRRRSHQQRR